MPQRIHRYNYRSDAAIPGKCKYTVHLDSHPWSYPAGRAEGPGHRESLRFDASRNEACEMVTVAPREFGVVVAET